MIVTVGALTSAIVLLAAIAVLRVRRSMRERRLARRAGAWRAAFHEAVDDPSRARLPPIGDVDLADFLSLWNHFQESLRGAAAGQLAQLLRDQGIDRRVVELLEERSLKLRLIAITALGHLQEERAWGTLEVLASGPNPVLSFAAARALLRIEPRRALDLLARDLVLREDWSIARVGSILQELGPALVTAPLLRMLVAPRVEGLERLVKLARFGHREKVSAAVREWLATSADPHVIAAALDCAEDAADLPHARGAARHAHWLVRMAAARALGRIGGSRELALLLELLRDPTWWVRHHAAQALSRLHGLTKEELLHLRDHARDAFAADMLDHVMAQRKLA